MARLGLMSLFLLVFSTPLAADECTDYRAAINAESAAFAVYQAARNTDSFAAAAEKLLSARDATQLARESVHYVPDETTRAASFVALEAASQLAQTLIDWKGEAVIVAAEDTSAYASWRYHEAVFDAACR